MKFCATAVKSRPYSMKDSNGQMKSGVSAAVWGFKAARVVKNGDDGLLCQDGFETKSYNVKDDALGKSLLAALAKSSEPLVLECDVDAQEKSDGRGGKKIEYLLEAAEIIGPLSAFTFGSGGLVRKVGLAAAAVK